MRCREVSLRGFFFAHFRKTIVAKAVVGGQVAMNKVEAKNGGVPFKRNEYRGTGAINAPSSATSCEIFPDGNMIELIGGDPNGNPRLLLWDGTNETTGPVVEHSGVQYEAAQLPSSVLRELILPMGSDPHGSTRELLADVCKLVEDFVGLPAMLASLVARFVLCSWVVEAIQVAPLLVLFGPDIARANRLVELLRRLCRHALLLTAVTPAGITSLASEARYTYIISQSSHSDKMRRLLDDASSRDRKIPFRGRLLDLFGLQVIHTDSALGGEPWPSRSIQISMVPTGQKLPPMDTELLDQITNEFQAKLLGFRRANLGAARRLQFDASKFTFALRDLACSMAAATPDDPELQAEVFELLQEQDAELRSEKWIDPNVVAVEAVLVAYFESPGGIAYVSDLAKIAQEISRRRGEEITIDPGVFGKYLKDLGFTTKRDAKGKKLHLTEAVRDRAEQLARDFGGPETDDNPLADGRAGRMETGPAGEVCT
jgi:hypothetical protein